MIPFFTPLVPTGAGSEKCMAAYIAPINHKTRTCVVVVVFNARLTSHTKKRRKMKNLETVPNFALYLLQPRFTALAV